jgi:hypothetical protein
MTHISKAKSLFTHVRRRPLCSMARSSMPPIELEANFSGLDTFGVGELGPGASEEGAGGELSPPRNKGEVPGFVW